MHKPVVVVTEQDLVCEMATGVVGGVDGVIVGPAFMAGGTFFQASQTLQFAMLAVWLWMVATGVVLFRAAGREPT